MRSSASTSLVSCLLFSMIALACLFWDIKVGSTKLWIAPASAAFISAFFFASAIDEEER